MRIREITESLVQEAGDDMLDISILNVDKAVMNTKKQVQPEKIRALLNMNFTVTQKFDGVKLSLWRNNEKYDATDYSKNWVVAYKNRIMYPEDFETIDREEIKTKSTSISQYALVHDHLKQNNAKLAQVPPGTEFFVEFIMNKPTTTRDYEKYHAMVLLAYAPAEATIEGGMIRTKPQGFNQDKVKEYASALEMMTPPQIFEGKLSNDGEIRKGIQSEELLNAYEQYKDQIDWVDWEQTFAGIKQMFLDVQSPFGGKEEGVVLLNDEGKFFKILQTDQHDKEVRMQKKMKYKADDQDVENQYWADVTALAKKITGKLKDGSINQKLKQYSGVVYKAAEDILPEHPKKDIHQIRDDVYLTGREHVIRSMKENQNALFLGKMRVLTKAHAGAIQQGLDQVNDVVVALVTGKDTKVPFALRKKMVEATFPGITVIEVSTGNLITAINKSKKMINAVIAGSDRVDAYKEQLKRSPNVEVIEIKRDMDSAENVSATRTFQAIADDNEQEFQAMTPPAVHPFFEELKQYVD